MKSAGAILIVLTSTFGCAVDNVDTAEAVATEFSSMQDCLIVARVLNEKKGQRALCLDTGTLEVAEGDQ